VDELLTYKNEDLTTLFFFKRYNAASLQSQILLCLTYLMLKAPTLRQGFFIVSRKLNVFY